MASLDDKSALLNALKIDREEESTAEGPTFLHLIIAALLSTGVAILFSYLLLAPGDKSGKSGSLPQTVKTNTELAVKSEATQDPVKPPREFGNSREVLNASGYITARRIATVSAEVMGLITSVQVEEGMRVQDGQILATLDNSVAGVNLALAQAGVEVVESRLSSIDTDLAEAERVLKRISTLGTESYSSEAQLTRAQADVDKLRSARGSAMADIKVAKLQVDQQREMLDNHTIRAPFAGVVTVKNAQPGEIVAPSSAGGGFTRTGICTIVDMDSLEIEVDVNEAFIGRVAEGQIVKANLDAYPQWDIPASVIAIIPTADRAKATVRVRIKIDLSDSRILPDMGVKVAFLKNND